MNTSEFSNEFDVLLNSHSTLKPFGLTQSPIELDEYEKSVLLTEAQELLVRELYKGVPLGESFEKTEEMRRSLDSLIKTVRLNPSQGTVLTKNSIVYNLPVDTWFVTYEAAVLDDPNVGCLNGTEIQVIPMTQDEYHRSSRNPFRKPSERKAIRLDNGYLKVEIVSEYNLSTYIVRYFSRPAPIILTNLEGVSINGQTNKTECELNSVTHRAILERAVQLALSRVPQTGK